MSQSASTPESTGVLCVSWKPRNVLILRKERRELPLSRLVEQARRKDLLDVAAARQRAEP
jgi:hypothetical protein